MPELDAMNPEMGPQNQPEQVVGAQPGQIDQEGAMAKADLYKLANYSFKLFKKMDDNDQLEAWVQAKITKAADYIASVYHYLEYEMEFSEYGAKLENSEMYSEGQKEVLKNKLMEAKEKIKALKVKQADKIKEGAILGGHDKACTECGGTGMIRVPERAVPEAVKAKVEKYNRKAKAMHAASKRIDKNKNGIPDDEELGEEQSSTGGEITRGKGFTRHSHNPDRFTDEPHTEPKSQAKSKSAADKAGDKAADKQTEKDSKDWQKRFGKDSVTKVSAGKKVDPNAKKEKEVDEGMVGQGVYEAKKKKGDGNLANNAKPYDKVTRGDVIAGRLGKDEKGGKDKKVEEAAPSAGMTKKEKSATVKDAKAGKDIGKPGKSFDKVAKAAGGGEKGEKIAAAAMWKAKSKATVKEAIAEAKKKADKLAKTDYDKDGKIETGPEEHAGAVDNAIKASKKETVNESADLNRMKEFLTRLNG
jgi:hypothetical protein